MSRISDKVEEYTKILGDSPSDEERSIIEYDLTGMVAARLSPAGPFLAPNLDLRGVRLVLFGMGLDGLAVDLVARSVQIKLRNDRFNIKDWQ